MSRYDDALFEAAERAYGPSRPSGEMTGVIERPVPHVGEEVDAWREFAVELFFDEGVITRAEVAAEMEPFRTSAAGPLRWRHLPLSGGPVTLTADERASLEMDFAELEAES